jgi:hypothetical protein
MRKLLSYILIMFLAFFPVQAMASGTVCEAHQIARYKVLDKSYITFQVNVQGYDAYRLYLTDFTRHRYKDIASGDSSGKVKLVISDAGLEWWTLGIKCK